MMKVIPAIDLIGNQVVRLTAGDFSKQTNYSVDPVDQALEFEQSGFTRLHVVDLEGARSGQPVHLEILRRICQNTQLTVDFGGGVRTEKDVSNILTAGADMISLGSIAIKDPKTVEKWISQFGAAHFFLGADVIGKQIAINAWKDQSDLSVIDFIEFWRSRQVVNFFSTDVSRDGKLAGPAIELYQLILKQFSDIEMVASGGVSSLEDLEQLDSMGMTGAIVGKAIYEGRISLSDLKKWK